MKLRSLLAISIPLVLLGSARATDPAPFQLGAWARPVPRHSVLAEPGYYVWGGSVVEEDGRYHMFYSRWPTSPWSFGDGWLFGSEICHAVADTPDGPFTPTGVVLGKRADDPELAHWDSQTQHNPHVQRFGDKCYLYYMASVDPGTEVWPGVSERNRIQRNQRIGVIAVDSLQDLVDGNFERPDQPILEPVYSTSAATDRSTNPTDFASNRIVNNPSVVRRTDGKYALYYKSNWPRSPGYGHGYALADDPAGPFTLVEGPVYSDEGREDENLWYDESRGVYHLLIKNFGRGGTEQLESADGVTWTSKGIQLGKSIQWDDGSSEPVEALERPQILRGAGGEPVMLYMACRRNLGGGLKEAFNVHIPLAAPAVDAKPFVEASELANSGLLVRAVNLGSEAPMTVNGVDFEPGGTEVAALVEQHGFGHDGGAAAAMLNTGEVDAVYEGEAAFEGLLDTIAWQTQSVQAGATLGFKLRELTPGRPYRLQLLFAESRDGVPARHGPQRLELGGESFRFDYGPASSMVAPGATAVRLTTTFVAASAAEPVTLVQEVAGGGGLQLSAFIVHDVSPPESGRIDYPAGGRPMVGWEVVPGFRYTIYRSSDCVRWNEQAAFDIEGGGRQWLEWTDPEPDLQRGFYRLGRSDS